MEKVTSGDSNDAKTTSPLSDGVDVAAAKLQNELNRQNRYSEYAQGHTNSSLMNWPILVQLSKPFISQIQLAFVYGILGNEALIVTTDNKVYAIGENSIGFPSKNAFHPRLVSELSNKEIETFKYLQGSEVVALAKDGSAYFSSGREFLQFPMPSSKTLNAVAGSAQPNAQRNNIFPVFGAGFNEPQSRPSSPLVLPNGSTFPTTAGFKFTPQDSGKALRIVQIATSANNVYTVTVCGKLYKWQKSVGGVFKLQESQIQLPLHIWISQIDCTHSTCFILSRSGKVYTLKNDVIQQIKSLENIPIAKIACGYDHTLALSRADEVYSWGSNDYGQLGHFGDLTVPTKVTITDISRVTDIAATHSCDISIAAAGWRNTFMWGKCGGVRVTEPLITQYETISEIFSYYATPRIMHQPIWIGKDSHTDVDLKKSLELAFDDPTTSDLVIEVEEKQVHVHKAILKIRSEYFNKMFQNGWKENDDNILRHDTFSFDTYKQYLRYLYTDKLDVSPVDAGALLPLADLYADNRLKKACIATIANGLTVNEAMYFYDIGVRANIQELVNICFNFATNHMNAILKSEAFNMLDNETMRNFIAKVAKFDVCKT